MRQYELDRYISTTLSDEIQHHGVLGQKWGVRRYQNADGSLTAEGRERYSNYANDRKRSAKIVTGKYGDTYNEKREKQLDRSIDKEARKAASRFTEKGRMKSFAVLRELDTRRNVDAQGYTHEKTDKRTKTNPDGWKYVRNNDKAKRDSDLQDIITARGLSRSEKRELIKAFIYSGPKDTRSSKWFGEVLNEANKKYPLPKDTDYQSVYDTPNFAKWEYHVDTAGYGVNKRYDSRKRTTLAKYKRSKSK